MRVHGRFANKPLGNAANIHIHASAHICPHEMLRNAKCGNCRLTRARPPFFSVRGARNGIANQPGGVKGKGERTNERTKARTRVGTQMVSVDVMFKS